MKLRVSLLLPFPLLPMQSILLSFSLVLFSSSLLGQQTLLFEDFNGTTWPPAGWSLIVGGNDPGWQHGPNGDALHKDYAAVETNDIITPLITLSNYQSLELSFDNGQIFSTRRGENQVVISTDLGQTWKVVYDESTTTDSITQVTRDLSSYASAPNILLAFRYKGPIGGGAGNRWTVDNVLLTATTGGGGTLDAFFSFTPGIGVAPLDVQFTDLSTGAPIDFLWNFGDGGSSTNQHPLYTYTQPGTFFPSLTITSATGLSVSFTSPNSVTVNSPGGGGGSGNEGTGGGAWNDLGGNEGGTDGGGFGSALANVHDLDQDGICDYAIGSPSADVGTLLAAGEVSVYSAATGTLLYRISGIEMDSQFGAAIASVGDVNGDGIPEILIGAPMGATGRGAAYLHDGGNGNLIHAFSGLAVGDAFGAHVQKAGDASLQSDGILDLLIGAPGEDSGGAVDNGAMYCFDAATGAQLFKTTGPPQGLTGFVAGAGPGLGNTTATISDVSGDGVADILVGVPWADVTTTSGLQIDAGIALIINGANGSTLMTLKDIIPQTGDFYGMAVAQAPDMDADGILDFAVGVAGEEIHTLAGGVLNDAGKIVVYSGSTGTVIAEIPGTRDSGQTGSNVTVGDANGDGVPDMVSGSKNENAGVTTPEFLHIDVFDSIGGGLIWTQEGAQGSRMGSAVAFICDLDGDGREDFLVGSPGADSNGMSDNGAFSALGYDSYMWTSDVHVTATNGFQLTWEFDFPVANAHQQFRVVSSMAGTGPTDMNGVLIPLTQDNLFWQTLLGVYPVPGSQFTGHLDASGDTSMMLNVGGTSAASWAGTKIWSSCIVFDQQRLPVVASGYVTLWIH